MKHLILAVALMAASVPGKTYSQTSPEALMHRLEQRFHPSANKQPKASDLSFKIRDIESRVHWLGTDAGYVRQDAQWAHNLLLQYLSGQNSDPYALWRAERIALSAAENAKKTSEKVRTETAEVNRLEIRGAEKSAYEEAKYLEKSARELASNSHEARLEAVSLLALATDPRWKELVGQRMIWAAEILDRESTELLSEARELERVCMELAKKLKPKED